LDNKKKILIFAPYGFWSIHHQVDAVIGAALKLRNCEVLVLYCDGVFVNCPLTGKPPNNKGCPLCEKRSFDLFSQFQLPMIKLSALITEKDKLECKNWVNNLSKEEIPIAKYKNKNIGKWITAGMHSYFVSEFIDLDRPYIFNMNLSFLYNGALISCAYERLIKTYYPNHVLCFHSILAYYRVFLELSLLNSIPALIHNGGPIPDSFMLTINENLHILTHSKQIWHQWKNIPLTKKECQRAKDYFFSRNSSRSISFYDFESDLKNVRKQLRIPFDAKIVAYFTSGDWEMGMRKWDIKSTFNSLVESINSLVTIFRERKEYLIIRTHPYCIHDGQTATIFIQQLYELCRNFPPNIRLVMPTEQLTSYAIMWHADAVITYSSTTGFESIARGCCVCSLSDNIFNDLGDIPMVESILDCGIEIDRTIHKTNHFRIEYLQNIYRGLYYLFYRTRFILQSVRFQSNSGKSDIQISDINELLEGNDPQLDRICSYIKEGRDLFPSLSNEFFERNNQDELNFLTNELNYINENRKIIRNQLKNCSFTEPLITVARIRQDGQFRFGKSDTKFLNSIKQSRHKNIEYREIANPAFFNIHLFIEEVLSMADTANGDYIYIAPDNTQIDESFLSYCIDFLSDIKNQEYDAVMSGAWIFSTDGYLVFEYFTKRMKSQRKDYDIIDGLSDISVLENQFINEHPRRILNDPSQFFSFFLLKRTSLIELITHIKNKYIIQPEPFLSLFQSILEGSTHFKVYKSLIPNIGIFLTKKIDSLINDGIQAFNEGRFIEALSLFDSTYLLVEKQPKLDYYRILTNIKLGRYWQAKHIVDSCFEHYQPDEKIVKLKVHIEEYVKFKELTYDDISVSIESVESALVPGQEKYLFNKIKSLPDNAKILEIGSYCGRSTVSMAYACAGTKKRIISIDTFMGNVEGGTRKKGNTFYDVWYLNLKRLNLNKYVTSFCGYSHKNLKHWNKPIFDFIFIDASHHYKDVLNDFVLSYPLLKDNGWVAFHNVEPGWPGTWRVWRETAMPILSSHEYMSTLACGQKKSEIHLIEPPANSSFSYSREWATFLNNFNPQVSKAMMHCMQQEQIIFNKYIAQAEKIIATMPHSLRFSLKEMLKLEASSDPILHYWYALTLIQKNYFQEALNALNEATRQHQLSKDIQERVEMYKKNLNIVLSKNV